MRKTVGFSIAYDALPQANLQKELKYQLTKYASSFKHSGIKNLSKKKT